MNELQIFNHPKFGGIRTITEDGNTLFCGKDVAEALGYDQPHKAIDRHCRYGTKRTVPHPQSPEKTIEMLFIHEGDIYRLAAKSELPGADEFESWIFDEVLPSIRRTGGYIAGQETMTPEELMAAALVMANKTIAEREARITGLEATNSALTVSNQIMAPKADYFDELVERNTLTNFRETAKQLGIGPKAFVKELVNRKYLYRDKRGKLLPYEDKNDGLLQVKECFNEKTQWGGTQTLVTPKGRETSRLLFEGL